MQLCDRLRSTNAGNNVFALRVHQELAEQLLIAGCRVTGKCNAGTGCIAHVAECHHLYVNGSTPGVRNIIITAVYVRTRVVPGTEYSFDRFHQLLLRISREIRADLAFVFFLELTGQLFQIVSGRARRPV